MPKVDTTIAILGGGIAGLGAAYYAKKNSLDYTLFESSESIGGNCNTFTYDVFKLDSGAHRFHDKDKIITEEIKNLMGNSLQEINLPSKIYNNHQFIHFPLQPLELLNHLGVGRFFEAGLDVLLSRLKTQPHVMNFEQFALASYGSSIANRFLLNYSRKLWGRPCDQLSPSIGGKRLKGLSLKTFLLQSFMQKMKKDDHMEGKFYYPKNGILSISETLARLSGENKIQCNARVSQLFHDGKKIHAIELNGNKRISCHTVINTLPLDETIQLLQPKLPDAMLLRSQKLMYRHLRLAAFFIDRASIMKAATLYFPSEAFPFTRLYEPKNRNSEMSPPTMTSLVAEIPCFENDYRWKCSRETFISEIEAALLKTNLVKQSEIIHREVYPMSKAYPVLDIEAVDEAARLKQDISVFSNMHLLGRNATYRYTWMHDILKHGKEMLAEIARQLSRGIQR